MWPHFEWGHEVVCPDNDICPVWTGVCIVAVGDHVHPRCSIVISPSCECIARVGNLGGPAVRFWRRWWAGQCPCIFLVFVFVCFFVCFVFGVCFFCCFLLFFCFFVFLFLVLRFFTHTIVFIFWCCVLIIRHATVNCILFARKRGLLTMMMMMMMMIMMI